jgi:superoxide dismutase, Fe-Mn family
MAQEFTPKELKAADRQLDGISENQIDQHYGVLYKGYVNKLNEIRAKLESADRSKANQTYSEFRALKIEEGFALDGAKLHELYFDNLGGKGGQPTGKIMEMIQKSFGSYESWETDFKACGMAARGWVVLAYDWYDRMVHNYCCDAHNQGGIWSASPVMVLDTYEHAYMIDYGVKRPPYIDAFMKNLDWDVVNERLGKLGL